VDLDLGNKQGATIVDVLLYLLGIAGLAASLTIIWLSMRAVLDIGGYCADGGPYEIAHHCPDGVGLLLTLSIFVGLGCAGLMAWKGVSLGAPYDGLVGLAWPALFISLGFNFLQFAFFPSGEEGIEIGFLIPGILFVIMGAAPLVGYLPGRNGSKPSSDTPLLDMAAQQEERSEHKQVQDQRAHLLADMVQEAQHRSVASTPAETPEPTEPTTENDDLVGKLERLSALYRAGSLNFDEFQKAKQALINEADK
jgi:hypothetical protein